jgi:hypothetical protein
LKNYNIDIVEREERDGVFIARCRETGTEVSARNPENDIAAALVEAGHEGVMQTWRDTTTPSLFYRSLHRAAGRRIELGNSFPLARVNRQTAPDKLKSACLASDAGGHSDADWCQTATQGESGCTGSCCAKAPAGLGLERAIGQ